MGDVLVHFDDAIVNTTDRLERYEVNIVFYRREDINPVKNDIDLGFLLHLQPHVYGIRRALNPMPIHDNFNKQILEVRPKIIEIPKSKLTVDAADEYTDKENVVATQSVENTEPVATLANTSSNSMTITSTQLANIITDALDLTLNSVSNKETDLSITAQMTEDNDSQLELPTLSNDPNIDKDKELSVQESDDTLPYDIEEGLDLGSENFVYPSEFDSSVHYSDLDYSTQEGIGNKTTDELSSANNESGSGEEQFSRANSEVDEKSETKSPSGEAVDTDLESDNVTSDTPTRIKPDWSLRPPLISNSVKPKNKKNPTPKPKRKRTGNTRNRKATRTQPKWDAKSFDQYIVASTSSSDETPEDPKDKDFDPEDMNGNINFKFFLCIILHDFN